MKRKLLLLVVAVSLLSCNNVLMDTYDERWKDEAVNSATDGSQEITAAISGVTAPVLGATPVTKITDTDQYTGTVSWDGGWSWSSRFGGNKAYTATITLTAKSGYSFTGIAANHFTIAGATSVLNSAGSGVVTAVFPATAAVVVGDSALGGKVLYILASGDTGYVAGEQRGLIAANSEQTTGIQWSTLSSYSFGTQTALGTGSANTDKIIAACGAGTNYAAGLARSYTGGGYTDWYLPSEDELTIISNNRSTIGNLSESDYYWCSSEVAYPNSARAILINGGFKSQASISGTTLRFRAIRSF